MRLVIYFSLIILIGCKKEETDFKRNPIQEEEKTEIPNHSFISGARSADWFQIKTEEISGVLSISSESTFKGQTIEKGMYFLKTSLLFDEFTIIPILKGRSTREIKLFYRDEDEIVIFARDDKLYWLYRSTDQGNTWNLIGEYDKSKVNKYPVAYTENEEIVLLYKYDFNSQIIKVKDGIETIDVTLTDNDVFDLKYISGNYYMLLRNKEDSSNNVQKTYFLKKSPFSNSLYYKEVAASYVKDLIALSSAELLVHVTEGDLARKGFLYSKNGGRHWNFYNQLPGGESQYIMLRFSKLFTTSWGVRQSESISTFCIVQGIPKQEGGSLYTSANYIPQVWQKQNLRFRFSSLEMKTHSFNGREYLLFDKENIFSNIDGWKQLHGRQ